MADIIRIVFFTGAAGACILIGGLLASFERIQSNWLEQELRHFLIAFGGGIMLGAIAVVFLPEGVSNMNHSMFAIPVILFGGITFFAIEKSLGLRRRESPQLMGMILDYVPEAIALGGLVALSSPIVPLLALLIGLQNLPEGFNAFKELMSRNHSSRKTLLTMSALVPLGPISGLIGYYFLSGHKEILGAIMLFSSGGILYLVFQDIAPQSRLEKYWGPPLGAVFGFCLVLFSEMLIAIR